MQSASHQTDSPMAGDPSPVHTGPDSSNIIHLATSSAANTPITYARYYDQQSPLGTGIIGGPGGHPVSSSPVEDTGVTDPSISPSLNLIQQHHQQQQQHEHHEHHEHHHQQQQHQQEQDHHHHQQQQHQQIHQLQNNNGTFVYEYYKLPEKDALQWSSQQRHIPVFGAAKQPAKYLITQTPVCGRVESILLAGRQTPPQNVRLQTIRAVDE
uniref:Uncharacterized protein n=1 Tax=Anopheles merus TaxID=30066 RepID=A0A182VA51_ANOME